MIGAWMSLAYAGRQISFGTMQDFVDLGFEPVIKLIFVGTLASIVALLLQLDVISLSLGTIDLSQFDERRGYALLLGLITGFSEKAASVQVIERVRGVFATSPD